MTVIDTSTAHTDDGARLPAENVVTHDHLDIFAFPIHLGSLQVR